MKPCRQMLVCVVLAAALLVAACDSATELTTTTPVPDPEPTTTTVGMASDLTRAEEQWSTLGLADYDLEYVIDAPGNAPETFRAVVRDGEAVNCYVDDVLSLRLECDKAHYTVGSLFDRLAAPGVVVNGVAFDPAWYYPQHADYATPDGMATLDVTSFAEADPIDWVTYVEDALAILQAEYAQPDSVDWDAVRDRALELVIVESRIENAYSRLQLVTADLPGAQFRTPKEVKVFEDQLANWHASDSEQPTGYGIGNVGYVQYRGAPPDHAPTYASAVHDLMRDIDSDPVCGWVVDLRQQRWADFGFDVLALGPLLGDGDVASWVVQGEEEAWSYVAGTAYVNGDSMTDFYRGQALDTTGTNLPDPYATALPDPPVALLSDSETLSWPAVAFGSVSHMRTFGEPAGGGLPVSVRRRAAITHQLPLGARLTIYHPVSLLDRTGESHDLRPDELVLPIPLSDTDEVLEAALAWLNEQESCQP